MQKGIKVPWHDEKVFVVGIPKREYKKEIAFQIYCATWLRKQAELYPENPYFKRWHHSANERKGAFAGLMAKLMGQSKGFPDFIHCGLKLAIELKVPGHEATPEQLRWLGYFKSIGWHSEVVFDFNRFKQIVLSAIESQN